MAEHMHDLLVVGSGPTGIAIGAEATKAKLDVLLVDSGQLTAAILNFPTFMTFFTTRDLLEIAGIPMSIPDDKPTRQQALTYYRAVADHYKLPLALHEKVIEAKREDDGFIVRTVKEGKPNERRAKAVALATGYFDQPVKLSVPGVDLPWVNTYYRDPYRHFKEDVVLVGGGNSACEAALDLYRNGAGRVTMVVREDALKDGVKYWVRPDVENRIEEGSLTAHFSTVVESFANEPRRVMIRNTVTGESSDLRADAAYVLIGFTPDADLQRRCGVQIDPETLVPSFNPDTCESNVPGLYIAGTLQAGLDTGRIFIENSRDHGARIVNHLVGNCG